MNAIRLRKIPRSMTISKSENRARTTLYDVYKIEFDFQPRCNIVLMMLTVIWILNKKCQTIIIIINTNIKNHHLHAQCSLTTCRQFNKKKSCKIIVAKGIERRKKKHKNQIEFHTLLLTIYVKTCSRIYIHIHCQVVGNELV